MKRSGDVTAAAIILFCGSGLLVLLMFAGTIEVALLPAAPEARMGELIGLVFYLFCAAWGIATGVGVLKLQLWARISIIVMSALAICGCVLSAVGIFAVRTLLRGDAQIPAGMVSVFVIVWAAMLLIPLAIAIWWLVLFTRRRVKFEFAAHSGPFPESAGTVPSLSAGSRAEVGSGAQGQLLSVSSWMRRAPQIPLSIRIITVLYIVGAAFILLTLAFSIQTKMPTLLLGFILRGWQEVALLTALAAVQLMICIAVFRKRAWALDALIAIVLFGIVNSFAFFVAPSRNALFDEMIQREPWPPGVDGQQLMHTLMNKLFPVSLAVGIILTAVVLYFLLTRRKAFRAACGELERAP